jgi:hypothetical protein
VVPTDDGKVRTMLRALGQPITLFGEKEVRARHRQGARAGLSVCWQTACGSKTVAAAAAPASARSRHAARLPAYMLPWTRRPAHGVLHLS